MQSDVRIAYYLSAPTGMAGELGGVRRNLSTFMELARSAGAEVLELDHWSPERLEATDLVHLSPADLDSLAMAREVRRRGIPYVVSPIIDKTAPNWVLRSVTLVDVLLGPLVHTHLGAAREICRHAAGIATMSNHEIERVRAGLRVAHVAIRRIRPPLASDAVLADRAAFVERHGASDFVLFAGDLANPRKNVLRLIAACAVLEYPLYLTGTLDVSTEVGGRVAAACGSGTVVRHLGVLDRPMLLSAMAACRAFALPSLVEGIGLAAVDAAAAGASVVVTPHGGPHDYLDDYAHYVEPNSIQSIAVGLRKAWNSRPSESARVGLRERLSPERARRDLEQLYGDALRRHAEAVRVR